MSALAKCEELTTGKCFGCSSNSGHWDSGRDQTTVFPPNARPSRISELAQASISLRRFLYSISVAIPDTALIRIIKERE